MGELNKRCVHRCTDNDRHACACKPACSSLCSCDITVNAEAESPPPPLSCNPTLDTGVHPKLHGQHRKSPPTPTTTPLPFAARCRTLPGQETVTLQRQPTMWTHWHHETQTLADTFACVCIKNEGVTMRMHLFQTP